MTAPRWLALGAALVYLLSLGMPAVQGPGFPDQSGLDMLQQGSGAWRQGVISWYANPALWLALLLVAAGRYRAGLATAGASFLIGLTSFGAETIAVRAGQRVPEFSFAAGFYVWLAAFALAALAAGVGIYKVSRAAGR